MSWERVKPKMGVAAPLPRVARKPMDMRMFCQIVKHLGVVLSICQIDKAPTGFPFKAASMSFSLRLSMSFDLSFFAKNLDFWGDSPDFSVMTVVVSDFSEISDSATLAITGARATLPQCCLFVVVASAASRQLQYSSISLCNIESPSDIVSGLGAILTAPPNTLFLLDIHNPS